MDNTNLEKKTLETPPEYLYHYTSVETLALILKNKNLRLNSLVNMDDKQEQISQEKQNYGKFIFVSSWTSNEAEDIPMWRMYTPKNNGIRIKMKSNPFVTYDITNDDIYEITHMENEYKGQNPPSIIPAQHYFESNYLLINFAKDKQLYEVNYTNDIVSLAPKILEINEQNMHFDLAKMGLYKNEYWCFQKEWRYLLRILPVASKQLITPDVKMRHRELEKFHEAASLGKSALPFDSYYLKLRDECLDDMTITLAPDISESARIIVDLLVKEYCPKCKIENSILTDLI